MSRWRLAWASVWTIVGLALVWGLFVSVSVTWSDAVAALLSTPIWLFLLIGLLTFANQVVGTLKWRVAAHFVAGPVVGTGFPGLLRTTSLGELFGQVVPVQLSTLLARFFLMDREARDSGQAIRATIFEQAFDLILVVGACFAALAVLGAGLPPAGGTGVFLAIVAIVLLGMRPILSFAASATQALARFPLVSAMAERVSVGFAQAASAPFGLLLTLAGYSLVRLLLVGLRAAAVLWYFAPETSSYLVLVASPAVTLLTALPLTPAGLGLAEWSWSAILVMGGTAAGVAAVAALNIRLINMVVVVVIVALLTIVDRSTGRRNLAVENTS